MTESFYLTLPSNVKNDFNVNTLSNYVTHLPRKYIFPPNENWEVALVEISYPKSWFTILKPQKISLFTVKYGEGNRVEIGEISHDYAFLQPGHYDNPYTLVTAISDVIRDKYGKYVDIEYIPELTYNKNIERVEYRLGIHHNSKVNYFISFDKELEQILGFIDEHGNGFVEHFQLNTITPYIHDLYLFSRVKSFRPLQMHAGYHTLYVYTDIVEYSGIGNTNAQLLRPIEVPPNKDFGDQIVLTYQTPFYLPLHRREFETIEISIKDETGSQVPFEIGRVIVVLHFRRKNESLYSLL